MRNKSLSGLLVSLMLALSLPVCAQIAPDIFYPKQGDFLSVIGTQTIPSNGAVVFTNALSIPVKQNTGIAIYASYVAGSNGVSNVVFNLGASPWTNNSPTSLLNGPTNGPGTTQFFTNVTLLSFTNTANGTNPCLQYAFIPSTSLNNAERLTIVSASTLQTNAVTVSNLFWFYTSRQP